MALELLDCEGLPPGPTAIAGDNLGVVRYCADTGRARDPQLHGVLDDPLARAACSARRIHWLAVRR
eukprot:4368679-Lingulodinium_polyedra.AAC.1